MALYSSASNLQLAVGKLQLSTPIVLNDDPLH